MKKILLIAFLLFSFKCFPAPSNTMSITPVAVAEATILADDENTRNNAVSTTYNAHSHTDIPSSSSNDFIVGDGQAGDKTFSIDNGDANSPSLKFDDTDNVWEAGSDGVNFYEIIVGGTAQSLAGTKTFTNIIANTLTATELTVTDLTATTADINAGTVDATIGGTTPAVGTFTTLTTTGLIVTTGTLTTSTLTTTDINGGTMDGVNVGAETLTGMLYVNNSSDDMDGLGSQGTDGQVLTSQGAGVNPTFEDSSTGSETFLSSGTFTAPVGVTQVLITGVAGGGGGAGGGAGDFGGGGGGSGSYIERVGVDVVAESGYTVTVGAGGAGGAASSNGVDGGNTSFAGATITITLNKGVKGTAASGGLGAGGAATGGNTVNASGTTAGYDNLSTAGGNGGTGGGSQSAGGAGGGSRYGKGGAAPSDAVGGTGLGFGSGGGGGDGSGFVGGAGQDGFILVEW